MTTDSKKPQNTVRNIDRGNDPSGTDPNRHSKSYAGKPKTNKSKINNLKTKAMSNKNAIIGIAAGVAALAVVGVILRRKGYFDNFSERAGEFGENVREKFNDAKAVAKQKFSEAIEKGSEIADKAKDAKTDAKIAAEKEIGKAAIDVATA
ncbi:hypothetical protein [Flavobacterium rhizosphaerae]|uniref:YtxH domain-containing protein n=1 Tax=Flavobacterium rhizosphaerae TaxID=3163298 RepID=A0ABW8YXB4_9FLAO